MPRIAARAANRKRVAARIAGSRRRIGSGAIGAGARARWRAVGLDHGAGIERGWSVYRVERIHRTVADAGGAGRFHAGKSTDHAFFQRWILERMGRDAKPDRISGDGDTGAGGDVAVAASLAAHHGAGGGDGRAGPDGGVASFRWSRGTEARRSELYVAGGRSDSYGFDRIGGVPPGWWGPGRGPDCGFWQRYCEPGHPRGHKN